MKMENVNMNEGNLELGIGTKEMIALEPVPVLIKEVKIAMQTNKNTGKEYGEKVICVSKHPSKEELIEISTVKYIKQSQIKTIGLWLNRDEDNLIMKNSALASFMCFFNIKKISDLKDKKIPTAQDEKGYLTFKAY